jgi:hypothetical protein
VTAAEVLNGLDEELDDRGVPMAFIELRDRLQDVVRTYGLSSTLDQEHFYGSLGQVLADIAAADGQPPNPAGRYGLPGRGRRSHRLVARAGILRWPHSFGCCHSTTTDGRPRRTR